MSVVDGSRTRPLPSFKPAVQVEVIAGELASDDTLYQRRQHPQRAAQFTLGYERDSRNLRGRLEGPRAVDRLRALDDMDAKAARALKLREFCDLLYLPTAG